MKKRLRIRSTGVFITAAIMAACIMSCRNFTAPERPGDYIQYGKYDVAVTWSSVFESFWTGMNNNYLFWSEDPTDWDAAYDTYRPKFAALDITKENDSDTAFTYFKAMTKDLIDGHYSLTISDSFKNSIDISPLEARIYEQYGANMYDFLALHEAQGMEAARASLPDSFLHSDWFAERHGENAFHEAIKNSMTGGSYSSITISTQTEDLDGFNIATGSTSDKILYFSFSDFSFGFAERNGCIRYYSQLFEHDGTYEQIADDFPDIDDEELLKNESLTSTQKFAVEIRRVMSLVETFFSAIKDPDIKGIVIDLRDNHGGWNTDLSYLWGKFISTEQVIAYSRSKLGDNRLDYSPWMPFKVFPDPVNGAEVHVPIVALVNKRSVSCAEVSAMFFSSLPNGYVVGGTSYGGQGTLTDNRAYNGGQFTAPYLDMVYTPSLQNRYIDGTIYEGKGFPPDVPVPFDEAAYQAMQQGTDTRLEAALRVIRDK
jgi:hypothetical protein